MAISTGLALLGSAAIGAIGSAKSAKNQSAAQQRALDAASTELSATNVFGPGGIAAGFGDFRRGQPSNFSFEDLASQGSSLAQFGGTQPANRGFGKITTPGGFGAPRRMPGAFEFGKDFERARFGGFGLPANRGNPLDSAGFNLDLGQLDPARSGLTNFATQAIGRAGLGTGLPQNVQLADLIAQLSAGNVPGADAQGLQQLEAGAGNLAGQSFGAASNLLGQGFQRGLAGQGFGVASEQLGNIAGSGSEATQQALAALRGQALPGQERAVQSALSNLFGSGRLGTTGGANVLGRLSEAQDQQDLGFQLAAQQEGRATQQNALGLAQGGAGLGSGISQLEQSLLQSAFGNFGQTANLASDLNTQRFGRNLGINELVNQRSQQNLQNQIGLAGLPASLQNTELGNALAALQGQSGLQAQGLNLANFGLNRDVAEANARIGAGSNIASITNNGNFGGTAGVIGNLGTSLFKGIAGTQGGQDTLGRIFGGIFGGGQETT